MNAPEPQGNRKRSRKRSSRGGKGGDGGRKRGRNRAPKIDPAEFWGDPADLPRPEGHVTSTPDVKAVVSSLGRPPLAGHETPAEHWFSLVYERAAVLAGALAAAGGLDPEHEVAPADDPTGA